jgi:hypothetical protein
LFAQEPSAAPAAASVALTRVLGNSAMGECRGQPSGRCGFIGPREYKTGGHGYLCGGAAILAGQDQSRAAISYIQDDGLASHVLMGSIPMMRNSPIGWSKY